MSHPSKVEPVPLKPSRVGLAAIYLVFAAVVVRTLTAEAAGPWVTDYLRLELVYIFLFSAAFFRPSRPVWLIYLYFVIQSILTFKILSLQPRFDFVLLLFAGLSYQASLFFRGRMRWTWVLGFVLLTGGSLIYHLGLLQGLALSLTTMAGEILIASYLVVNEQTEMARVKSQALLNELQLTNQQLASYASQVEELAAMQERHRVARKLHDGVSQLIFSISLMTRSAQLLLEKNPGGVQEQLTALQEVTADALSQLRSLITQLRPPQNT